MPFSSFPSSVALSLLSLSVVKSKIPVLFSLYADQHVGGLVIASHDLQSSQPTRGGESKPQAKKTQCHLHCRWDERVRGTHRKPSQPAGCGKAHLEGWCVL